MSGMVPKLRFPEFRGVWKALKLNDYLIRYQNKVSSNTEIPIFTSSREGLKPQSHYFDGRELANEGEYGLVPVDYFTYRHMSDDLTFKFNRNSTGHCIAVSKEYPIFTVKDMDATLLHLWLNNSPHFSRFAAMQKLGGTRTRLYYNSLCQLDVIFPTLPEQQKIADFLSSIDVKIDAVKRKRDAFERYKKGLMQQIFSQKIRFKQDDGSDFPEWEEKRLGEAGVSIKSGLTIDQDAGSTGFKVTRIETISESKVNLARVGYISTAVDVSDYLLKSGDILFSNINSVKHIGKMALITDENDLYHGMNLLRIIPGIKFNSVFLYNYLTSTPLKRHFERVCNQAVSQASINQTELKLTKIKFPSLPEQQKIADFLSAMASKIDAITSQIQKLEAFKKGLLQQMFV